ncbi:MAG: AMP-binding protein, partial [Phenylobacterium sp.]|uniref:AMP-binding protein n=1 Tax=Phenylobacterium sp. TaxID=1871053 RepID=UPI0030175CF9
MTDTASLPPANRAQALAILTAPGQPYELATLEIGGYLRKVFAAAPPTLRELFAAAVSDATFLVYGEERLTFSEVALDAARLAAVLVSRFGVGKGDRVAFSMRNFPEWVIVYQAATSIGAVAVAMNALWQSDELEYGLKDSGAKVFIADQERLDRLAGCSPDLNLPVIAVRADRPGKAARYEDLMAEAAGATLPVVDIAPEDDATIFYTSGSTGHPKGVVSSHRNIISALFSWELDVRAGGLVAGIEPVPPARQP